MEMSTKEVWLSEVAKCDNTRKSYQNIDRFLEFCGCTLEGIEKEWDSVTTYEEEKLFQFLDQYITTDRSLKHVVLACHLGRIWKFKELPWKHYDNNTIPETVRVSRKNRSNWKYNQ